MTDLDDILAGMLAYAIDAKLIDNSMIEKDLFDTKIMGCITPMPSVIIQKFQTLAKKNSDHALNYFYNLCKDVNYVRISRIQKDLHFKYGRLNIKNMKGSSILIKDK